MKRHFSLRRALITFYGRIVREKASPTYIARGWAIGMFYGCLIPFGFQLACSIPTAFLLKGSKLGATIGTFLTNHVTIFFIYPAQCWVGIHLIGGDVSLGDIRAALTNVMEQQSYDALMSIGTELLIGFFIGGAILTAICTPLTYFTVLLLVKNYRRRKGMKHQAPPKI